MSNGPTRSMSLSPSLVLDSPSSYRESSLSHWSCWLPFSINEVKHSFQSETLFSPLAISNVNPVCGTKSKAATHTNAASSLLILPLAAQPCYGKHQIEVICICHCFQNFSLLIHLWMHKKIDHWEQCIMNKLSLYSYNQSKVKKVLK